MVHLDGCVEVEAAYYGLPPGWIGHAVQVQWDELFVRILDPKSGEVWLRSENQPEGLQVGADAEHAFTLFRYYLAQIKRASLGRDRPKYIGQVLGPRKYWPVAGGRNQR